MKTHALCAFAFVLPLATLPLAAQQASEPTRTLQPGSLSGHVTCADTQRPARLAQIRLLRVPVPADLSNGDTGGPQLPSNLGEVVETSLDGSFTIANIKPGRYYLIAEYQGYLDPVATFTSKQLAQPDAATRQRIEAVLQPIEIGSGQSVSRDISLERGSSLAGTVTYDDGTPAVGISVLLLAHGDDGKWTSSLLHQYEATYYGNPTTDDHGRFRVTGLPPGDYLMEANLTLNEHTTTTMPNPQHPEQTMTMYNWEAKFTLPLYTGNVWREKLAVPISLTRGEDKTGIDLAFPLSKLHPVSGQVLAKDSQPVNMGKVDVVYSDDHTLVTGTHIDFAEARFKMDFVPEGEYLLAVSGAKDITHYQVENPKGYSPRTHEESKTLRTYPDAEQPLIVKGDTSDVILNLANPSKAKPQPTANE